MGIEIFSKLDCKYCTYAETMCKDLNLEYTKIIVDKDELKKQCGPGAVAVSYTHLTLPTILLV